MFLRQYAFQFFFVLAITLMISAPELAFAQNCPRVKTETEFKTIVKKLNVQRTSAKNLTQWVSNHTGHDFPGTVLGLASGGDFDGRDLGTKFYGSFSYRLNPDNTVCVALDKVKAVYYANPRYFIASDYKRGTCEYEAIKVHEERHVKAMMDFYERNVDRFRTQLGRSTKRVPLLGPVPREKEHVDAAKQKLMDAVMYEYYKYFYTQMIPLRRLQGKIDSPSEYRYVFNKCSDW